ncbi:MAG: ArnT family glycosyltransferase [Chthoniobacterales bacterium]
MQRAIRNSALVFIGALLFHLAGTWSLPLIDRDEPRFAEASREMRERSDYVVPFFNAQYRFDKPPLTYWAQVASFHFLGENDFGARLPTAIAAALTALVILMWGRRIADERVGLWAAVIFTLCLQTFIHGKAAVADMWLVLFVTLAHWAGWELQRERRTPNAERRTWISFLWWFNFYVALALAFLAKGPIGWTPLLAVAGAWFCSGGRWPRLATAATAVAGIALILGIVALWGIPALIRTNGEFFQVGIGKHVVARSFGAMEGHGANSAAAYIALLPFYFVTVFASFFPWSIKLPALTRRLWRNRDLTDTYLIVGALVIFVIFTFVKTKLIHYTLPAFPLLALLMARHLASRRFFQIASFATATACLVVALFVFPIIGPEFPSAELFKMAGHDVPPEMEIGAVDYTEPSLVWYFRGRTHGWLTKLDPATVQIFMQARGARCVVLSTSLAQKLYPELPPTWKRYTTSGINFVHGNRAQLTLLLKPS